MSKMLDPLETRRFLTASALAPWYGQAGVALLDTNGDFSSPLDAIFTPAGESVLLTRAFPDRWSLARMTATGQVDPTFNQGSVSLPAVPHVQYFQILADPRGGYLVTGTTNPNFGPAELIVARVRNDGTPDATYGVAGVSRVVVNPQRFSGRVATVFSDGSILTLTDQLYSVNPLTAADVQSLVKLTPTGQLDASFGVGGRVALTGQANVDASAYYDLVAVPGDRVVVVGQIDSDPSPTSITLNSVAARFDRFGAIDTGFGPNGTGYASLVPDAEVPASEQTAGLPKLLPDGKLMFMGFADGFVGQTPQTRISFLRLTADGLVDPTLSDDGRFTIVMPPGTSTLGDYTVTPGGKVLMVGSVRREISGSDTLVMRTTADGALDPFFGVNGFTRLSTGFAFESNAQWVSVDNTGGILLAGSGIAPLINSAYVARLNGTPPPNPGGPGSFWDLDRQWANLSWFGNDDLGDSITREDFILRNLTTGEVISPAQYTLSYSAGLGGSDGAASIRINPTALPDGRYRLTLPAGSVRSIYTGEPNTVDASLNYDLLRGDANLDGVVNFSDLLVVAGSYNTTNTGYRGGDFNYDGVVNFADLLIVAQRYGNTLVGMESARSRGQGRSGRLASGIL
jgi:uncharacterized delta-60 repeat protein